MSGLVPDLNARRPAVGPPSRRRTALARLLRALALAVVRAPSLVRAVLTRRPTLRRFEDYLRGVAVVGAAFEHEGRLEPEGPRVLLVSDVHDNLFGAAIAARAARGLDRPVDLVLLAGDVTDAGTAAEAEVFLRLFVPSGAPVLLVGGNHEAAPALRAFEQSGLTVLDWRAVTVAGLTVYGVGDPLAASSRVEPDGALADRQSEQLAALWPGLGGPDVLLVHDVRQARGVIRLAGEAGASLVVACGHDHRPAVEQHGPVTVVNAGTAGASGHEALGRGERAVHTAQMLDFAPGPPPRLRRVTTLSYEPGGRSQVTVEPVTA